MKSALPPAAYVGGKKLLARRLCGLIERVPHTAYVEPFVGMGGVFFRRRERVRREIINDYNGDVANLFRILQRHYVALTDELRWQVTSREHFERLRETPAESLTDIERAIRFLYVQRLAFGGQVNGRSFNTGSARFDVVRLLPQLEAVHERLSSVTIECRPYADILTRYDGPDVLFYLDPPYWGTEDYYDAPFSREDFAVLADILRGVSGVFLMSLNDCDGVRETFSGLHMLPVTTRYAGGVGGGSGRVRDELVISNRPLREV
ncbi:MAG: DNA adenine methylase [Acetobacter sp.]|uniref:DNA adenine methylase n=1 Tax=Acetobacter sp. TaxID=440 RepID=UPI0039EBE795